MNDDVKAAVEYVREQTDMRVVQWKRELYGHLLAHLDGEPARTAAAVAAAREEQREADAKFCPNCLGVGFVERPVPCPYCDDSTHDHYCPTGTQRQHCGCGAERIRATSLTATPLADRIAELEAAGRELVAYNTKHFDRATAEFERAEKAEAERDALRWELADLIPLAESAMRQANNDGAEYDIKAELAAARRVAEANMQTAERASRSIDDLLAERDALRARVFEVEQRQVGYVLVSFASHEQWKAELAECDALRARVTEMEAQASDLCMTIGKAREDNLALVADNEKLTAKIKDKG